MKVFENIFVPKILKPGEIKKYIPWIKIILEENYEVEYETELVDPTEGKIFSKEEISWNI